MFGDPLADEDWYKFHTEQLWAWELTLTEGQERAFMAGLEAYDDDVATVYPSREDGVLKVYRRGLLISLFWLTERFAAMGLSARQDPAAAVEALIDQAAQGETGGVLHVGKGWMGDAETVDGMDSDDITEAAMNAMFAQGVEHAHAGGGADENYGYATMGVLREEPEHARRIWEEAVDAVGPGRPLNNKFDVAMFVREETDPRLVEADQRLQAEKSKYANTLMFCLRRVLEGYHFMRPQMSYAEPKDVLSVVMARMLAEGRPGCTWTKRPTQDQHELALEILTNRS